MEKKENNNRKVKKEKKYENERMNERIKREKTSDKKGKRGMNQVKEKNIKVQGRMSRC
jgi:hypothetical protein